MTNREKEENYAIRIREEYSPKGESDIDALRKLDKRVKRPAEAFAWTFGVLGTLVLGVGMCLAMEVIGSIMPLGVVIGVVGIAMVCANPFIYKKILAGSIKKHGADVIRLSDKVLSGKEKDGDTLAA